MTDEQRRQIVSRLSGRNWQQLISDLETTDRELMEKLAKFLSHLLLQCEDRARGYGEGRETVLKLLYQLKAVRETIGEAENTLKEKHNLPELP